METGFKQRVLQTTKGTQLGAILSCAMGEDRDILPRYVGKASITSDGFIMCSFIGSDGEAHSGAFVGSVEDLDANLLRLKTHMHLSNAQYNDLTTIVAGWIADDWRSSAKIFGKAGWDHEEKIRESVAGRSHHGGRHLFRRGHGGAVGSARDAGGAVMPRIIDSNFAILDVKHGRVQLARRVRDMEQLGIPVRIPVTIRGYITGTWSNDDGTSIEFQIDVASAVERLR